MAATSAAIFVASASVSASPAAVASVAVAVLEKGKKILLLPLSQILPLILGWNVERLHG